MLRDLPSRRAVVRGFAAVAAGAALAPVAALADTPKIALVHTQAAGDNGVVDGMIASLKRIGRERNLTVRAIYASDAANYQPILELLGEARAEVVLVTFNEMTQPLRAVAPSFPNTRFIQLYGDPMVPLIRNVRTVAYETHQAGYLSGMFGALVSRTPKLGYIGGLSIPTLDANVNAQIAGARSVRPSADVSAAFVGSFQDPVKALEIADQMFGSGVEYVQSESAASDLGVIQSANARSGRLVSGGSRPQFALGAQSVVAIELCDFGKSLYDQTTAALAPNWTPGEYRSGLQDGVVDFIPSPLFFAKGPAALVARTRAVWPGVVAIKDKIIAGAVSVPFKTNLG